MFIRINEVIKKSPIKIGKESQFPNLMCRYFLKNDSLRNVYLLQITTQFFLPLCYKSTFFRKGTFNIQHSTHFIQYYHLHKNLRDATYNEI